MPEVHVASSYKAHMAVLGVVLLVIAVSYSRIPNWTPVALPPPPPPPLPPMAPIMSPPTVQSPAPALSAFTAARAQANATTWNRHAAPFRLARTPGRACPLNFRQRQHADALFVDRVLGWTFGGEYDSHREHDEAFRRFHGTVTRDLKTVPNDFVEQIDRAPSDDIRLPVETTVRNPIARGDFLTRDVAFSLQSPRGTNWGHAVDVHSGMLLARSNFALSMAYQMLIGVFPHESQTVAMRTLRALRNGTEEFLPEKKDGYFWAIDWCSDKPGHSMDHLSQLFASHYEHWKATGKNATLILPEVHELPFFNEWVPFLLRHYPVDVVFLPRSSPKVYRANVTFGVVFDLGIRPTSAAFFSEAIAPSVISWCRARPGKCQSSPFVDHIKWGGDGGISESVAGAQAFRKREGLRVSRTTDSIESRVFSLATADVVFYNWGGAAAVGAYFLGGLMPQQHLPWPRASLDGMRARTIAKTPEGCAVARAAQRVVLMGSAKNHFFYQREVFDWAYLYGRVNSDTPEGRSTPAWYVIGEEMGHTFFPGAAVKVEWFGSEGDKWFPDAGAFDDAAFRLDDATEEAVRSEHAPAALKEINADDALYDHLLRTHRVMLVNQWAAAALGPAARCPRVWPMQHHPEEGERRCPAKLRPFLALKSLGAELRLAPLALDGTAVLGEHPLSRGMAVARRTTGLARYFVGGTSDAVRQATEAVAPWRWDAEGQPEAPASSYADVVTTFVAARGGGGAVIVRREGEKDGGVVVPNSHPCFGVLSEITIARPRDATHCPALYESVASIVSLQAETAEHSPNTTAIWLASAPEEGAAWTAADATQAVLARLGHLVLEGTLDQLVKKDGNGVTFAVVTEEPTAYARAAVDDLLRMFGIQRVVRVAPGHSRRFAGTRVVVPPAAASFRLQFSAQQFAATRWMQRRTPVVAPAQPRAFSEKLHANPRGATAICILNGTDPHAFVAHAKDAAAALEAGNVHVGTDVLPSELAALWRGGLTTLAVFHGPAVVHYAGLWADMSREHADAPALNLVVLCVPEDWMHCNVGFSWNRPDMRSRFFSNGREYNLPHGANVQYVMVDAPSAEAAQRPPYKPLPLERQAELGRLHFGGVPRTIREYGSDPEQPAAELDRIRHEYQQRLGNKVRG